MPAETNDSTTPAERVEPYLVLARKYRPQTFADLVGQEHVTRTLQNAITSGRIHHAYLFTGSRGTGKTSTARIFAKALNCVGPDGKRTEPTPEPCGVCSVCKQIAAVGKGAETFALYEIDGATNRGIDDVRELRQTIQQKVTSRYRVIVIDEVHSLTKDAFNALLKTLEEPPRHVKFVFATTEVHKVLDTIISRCQRFDFRRLGVPQLAEFLKGICEREGVDVPDDVLHIIARAADGGIRDSLSKLDQAIAFCPEGIDTDAVEGIFGLLSRQRLMGLIAAFIEGKVDAAFQLAKTAYEDGLDLGQLLRDLQDMFRDLMILKECGDDTSLVDIPDADRADLQQLAQGFETDTLLYAMEILAEGQRRLRFAGFPRLALELTFLKLCKLGELVPLGQLVDSLSTGQSLPAQPAGSRPASGPSQQPRSQKPAPTPAATPGPPAKKSGGLYDQFMSRLAQNKSDTKKKTAETLTTAKPVPPPAQVPQPAAGATPGNSADAGFTADPDDAAPAATAPPQPTSPGSTPTGKPTSALGVTRRLRGLPAVQDLLREFSGQVLWVREGDA